MAVTPYLAIPAAVLALGGAALAFGPGGWTCPNQAEHVRDHVERAIDIALDPIEATDAQRDAIKSIFADTADEMLALHAEHVELRDAALGALLGAEVDRPRLEELRLQAVDLFDSASRLVVEDLSAAAEELTPEQRAELQTVAQRFHERVGH